MAANLPFKYMGAVMFGNGISGIAANILRAVTLASFPAVPNDSSATEKNNFYAAVVFLSIGSITLFFCVFIQHFVLRKNNFYIYYLDWIVAEKEKVNNLDVEQEAFDYGLANTKSDLANSVSGMTSPNSTTASKFTNSVAKPPKRKS